MKKMFESLKGDIEEESCLYMFPVRTDTEMCISLKIITSKMISMPNEYLLRFPLERINFFYVRYYTVVGVLECYTKHQATQ